MDLVSIQRAAVLYFVQISRTNPLRKSKDRELTDLLVRKFAFRKFPVSYDDFNNQDTGVTFSDGVYDGHEIGEVRFFNNGLIIDAGGTTAIAEEVFDELVTAWTEVGLSLTRDMITERTYSSQMVVQSEIDLLRLNDAISDVIDNWFPRPTPAGPVGLGIQTTGAPDNTAVRIERLANMPLTAMQFWCQAPLPTELHIAFMNRWEAALRETVGARPSSPTEPGQPSSRSQSAPKD